MAAEHHTTRVTRVRPVRGPAARFTWLRLVRPRRGTGAEFTTSAANPLPDQYAQRHPHAADITSSISVCAPTSRCSKSPTMRLRGHEQRRDCGPAPCWGGTAVPSPLSACRGDNAARSGLPRARSTRQSRHNAVERRALRGQACGGPPAGSATPRPLLAACASALRRSS